MIKCVTVTWLAKADLSNLNSGEGSGNLTELKLYYNGQKPYISGQATRTALMDTIARSYPDKFLCTPERPCADVANCWSCDLRGFLATKEGVGGDRRWSPLKVSPGLGQIPADIVTDLLTRSSIFDKGEDRESKDMRIAHVQMAENIYKFGMTVDIENIGKVKEPILEGKGKNQKLKEWKETVNISAEERKLRINAVLDGIYNLSGFAKQARAATSLAPDIVMISLQETYNQRGLKALEVNDDRTINISILKAAIQDHKNQGNTLLFGYTPGVVTNESELESLLKENNIEVQTVYEAFKQAKELIKV